MSKSLNDTRIILILSGITSTRFMNINTASLEELNKLFGVGETIAQQIIKYREEKGGFKKPEDIKLVDGIGDTKWNVWLIDGWVITVNDE